MIIFEAAAGISDSVWKRVRNYLCDKSFRIASCVATTSMIEALPKWICDFEKWSVISPYSTLEDF
jgi:hypothetical protein